MSTALQILKLLFQVATSRARLVFFLSALIFLALVLFLLLNPGPSHPAALSDFLLLLLLLRLSTTATVGGGGQESVPVAYGFPLC